MDASLIVNIVSAATLLAGLGFAMIQLRQFRIAREREMTLELLRSYQTPEFAAAVRLVFALPEGLTAAELEQRFQGQMDLVAVLLTTFESLGILVFRRELSLDLVDDFFSGLIIVAWRKLAPYIAHLRAEEGRETIGEWVQWLHDRMREREDGAAPVPAYIAYRDWKPK